MPAGSKHPPKLPRHNKQVPRTDTEEKRARLWKIKTNLRPLFEAAEVLVPETPPISPLPAISIENIVDSD